MEVTEKVNLDPRNLAIVEGINGKSGSYDEHQNS
jgi:hypothetical protein